MPTTSEIKEHCKECDKCLNCEFAYEQLLNVLLRVANLEKVLLQVEWKDGQYVPYNKRSSDT